MYYLGEAMDRYNLLFFVRNYVDNVLKCFAERKWDDDVKVELKRRFIESIVNHYSNRKTLSNRIGIVHNIYNALIDGLVSSGFNVVVMDGKLRSPATIGVSQGVLKAVLEVGVCWNHIVDLPMIPGSSVKGAVRGALETIAGERGISNSSIEVLFGKGGHEGWAGLLLFFDAYPVAVRNSKGLLLEPDIVSPHYMKGSEVVRYERLVEPVPVPHVSIAPGTVFRFVIAAEPSEDVESALNELMKSLGKEVRGGLGWKLATLLVTAFEFGIGARTSRGYGKFVVESLQIYMEGARYRTPVLFKPRIVRRGRSSRR